MIQSRQERTPVPVDAAASPFPKGLKAFSLRSIAWLAEHIPESQTETSSVTVDKLPGQTSVVAWGEWRNGNMVRRQTVVNYQEPYVAPYITARLTAYSDNNGLLCDFEYPPREGDTARALPLGTVALGLLKLHYDNFFRRNHSFASLPAVPPSAELAAMSGPNELGPAPIEIPCQVDPDC
jgi:hypothetical protein